MALIKKPKILLLDIEATNLSANFGYLLCFGYKWLGAKTTQVLSITDYKKTFGQNCTNDRELLKDVAPIMEQSDQWVGWYSTRFDVPFLQTRRLLHNMPPIGDKPHVDGWWVARQRLKFTSNRLDTVSKALPLGENEVKEYKTPLSSQHWIRGAAGHLPSIQYIVHHCKQDVKVLEQVYEKIRPFAQNLPNMSLISNNDRKGCPACSASFVDCITRGYKATAAVLKRQYSCKKCGHWFSLPMSVIK